MSDTKRDIFRIIWRNFSMPIVVAILILAMTLLYLGEKRDAWFVSFVIIVNTLVAVIQEIRALMALKKLEMMSAPRAKRYISGGATEEIGYELLEVGDKILIAAGDEVPADVELIESKGLEVDESILTGESASISKKSGDKVLASISVLAGMADAVVVAVGDDTEVGRTSKKLKRYSPELTPLQRKIQATITFLTFGALGLTLLIAVVYWLDGIDTIKIVKTITSAAVTVVPEGLLLASSLLLAFGSLKLAQAKVLPQKLSAIEAMALLDILCVDKTGTLTSPEIIFDHLELFDEKYASQKINEQILFLARESGSNATSEAILNGLEVKEVPEYKTLGIMAFSSARKMSAIRITLKGKTSTIFMGAPDFVKKIAPLSAEQSQRVDELSASGNRVLLVALSSDDKTPLQEIYSGAEAVCLVVLSNALRSGVENTVKYLQNNDVEIRVISGDNQKTVQYIAEQAGIKNYERAITGEELSELKDDDWREAVFKNRIFTRVLPDQKEAIIMTLQEKKNFVGMVGDGVNDALALKRANLGVAMFSGSTVSRRVSDLVLLNNSFNSLPMGMRLGNRIMQAIENISVLFFHKIIYGVVLLFATILLGILYPIGPRNITYMNFLLVTTPTILWTLFPPVPKKRINPSFFWKDTLFAVAPISIISGAVVATSYTFLHLIHPSVSDAKSVSTTVVIIATLFGVNLVFMVPHMFKERFNRQAKLAQILYVLVVVFVSLTSFGIGFIRDFFDFQSLVGRAAWPLLLIIILALGLQWSIAFAAGRRLEKRSEIRRKER